MEHYQEGLNMNENQKSLTLNGFTGTHALHLVNSFAMLIVSFYLMIHYYEVHFPEQLGGASGLCDLSSFWNCDAATHSKAAAFMGVPTGFFGVIVSLLFLISSLMGSVAQEKTCSFISKVNFAGCIVFFIYSLTSLGSLCPFCTLYYILSGLALLLYTKFGINSFVPDLKVSAIWLVVFIAGSFGVSQYTNGKSEKIQKLNGQIVGMFNNMPDLGNPDVESPYVLATNGSSFKDALIRVVVFSDFQCPFCKVVAEQMHTLMRRYKKHLSVQYFFYPLDNACNAEVKTRFHDKACQAAYLAACKPENFASLHDEIFAIQDKLSSGALEELARKKDMLSCLSDPKNKDIVVNLINQAQKFNIKSTPTIIVNGKKIEGSIPTAQFEAIFDSIINEKK